MTRNARVTALTPAQRLDEKRGISVANWPVYGWSFWDQHFLVAEGVGS